MKKILIGYLIDGKNSGIIISSILLIRLKMIMLK